MTRRAGCWTALERGLAGVTVFGPNIAGPEQLAALTAQLRRAGGQPLIAIDEEGGDVTRIAHLTGSPYPGNAALGAVDDVALTAAVYRALGQDLAGARHQRGPGAVGGREHRGGQPGHRHPLVRLRHRAGGPARGRRGPRAAGGRGGRVRQALPRARQHQRGQPSRDRHGRGRTWTRCASRDLPPFAAAIAAGVAARDAWPPAGARADRRPARHAVRRRADRPAARRARASPG